MSTRMLWVSNGRMWKTGYGGQTDLFLPRIKAAGFDPLAFAFTNRVGNPLTHADGILELQACFDMWGNDIVAAHMDWSKAAFSFGLFDFYMAEPAVYALHPHAQWVPVDNDPLRDDLLVNLKNGARWVIAMSKYGERVLQEAGFDPLYVPHGIDTKLFRPIDRAEARARMQARIDKDTDLEIELGDKFVVLMNAANISARKGFFEAMSAFKAFHERVPESVLYLHTDMVGVRGQKLFEHVRRLGLDEGAVAYPNQYYYTMGMIDGPWINDLYNTADVLLNPAYGEGFGIPIIEAQAAGCPVIVTDCSSMSELCFSGIKVGGQRYAEGTTLYWTRPNIDELVEALLTTAGQKTDRQAVSQKVQDYDIDKVFERYMLPTLRLFEEEVNEPEKALDHQNTRRKVITVNGVELVVRKGTFDEWIANEVQEVYCPDLIDFKSIKRAVDIGAHIGTFSAWLKHQSPAAKIVAIEAMERNAELLKLNTNGKRGDDITVLVGRAGYTAGEYDVQIPRMNSGGYTLVKKDGPEIVRRGETIATERAYEGRMIPLSEALSRLDGDPDLLKLDCEGGEFDILLNAPIEDLKRFRWIVGEYHADMGNLGDILNRLAPHFEVRRIRATALSLGIFCLERK